MPHWSVRPGVQMQPQHRYGSTPRPQSAASGTADQPRSRSSRPRSATPRAQSRNQHHQQPQHRPDPMAFANVIGNSGDPVPPRTYDPLGDQHLQTYFRRPHQREQLRKAAARELLEHEMQSHPWQAPMHHYLRTGETHAPQQNTQSVIDAFFQDRRSQILHNNVNSPLDYVMSVVPQNIVTPRPPSANAGPSHRPGSAAGRSTPYSRPTSSAAAQRRRYADGQEFSDSSEETEEDLTDVSHIPNSPSTPIPSDPYYTSRPHSSAGHSRPTSASSRRSDSRGPMSRAERHAAREAEAAEAEHLAATASRRKKKKKRGTSAKRRASVTARTAQESEPLRPNRDIQPTPTHTATDRRKVSFVSPSKTPQRSFVASARSVKKAEKVAAMKAGRSSSPRLTPQPPEHSHTSTARAVTPTMSSAAAASSVRKDSGASAKPVALDALLSERLHQAELDMKHTPKARMTAKEARKRQAKITGRHHRAATQIQAWYIGAYVRRLLVKSCRAAIIIQRAYRETLRRRACIVAAKKIERACRGFQSRRRFFHFMQRRQLSDQEKSERVKLSASLLSVNFMWMDCVCRQMLMLKKEPLGRSMVELDAVEGFVAIATGITEGQEEVHRVAIDDEWLTVATEYAGVIPRLVAIAEELKKAEEDEVVERASIEEASDAEWAQLIVNELEIGFAENVTEPHARAKIDSKQFSGFTKHLLSFAEQSILATALKSCEEEQAEHQEWLSVLLDLGLLELRNAFSQTRVLLNETTHREIIAQQAHGELMEALHDFPTEIAISFGDLVDAGRAQRRQQKGPNEVEVEWEISYNELLEEQTTANDVLKLAFRRGIESVSEGDNLRVSLYKAEAHRRGAIEKAFAFESELLRLEFTKKLEELRPVVVEEAKPLSPSFGEDAKAGTTGTNGLSDAEASASPVNAPSTRRARKKPPPLYKSDQTPGKSLTPSPKKSRGKGSSSPPRQPVPTPKRRGSQGQGGSASMEHTQSPDQIMQRTQSQVRILEGNSGWINSLKGKFPELAGPRKRRASATIGMVSPNRRQSTAAAEEDDALTAEQLEDERTKRQQDKCRHAQMKLMHKAHMERERISNQHRIAVGEICQQFPKEITKVYFTARDAVDREAARQRDLRLVEGESSKGRESIEKDEQYAFEALGRLIVEQLQDLSVQLAQSAQMHLEDELSDSDEDLENFDSDEESLEESTSVDSEDFRILDSPQQK